MVEFDYNRGKSEKPGLQPPKSPPRSQLISKFIADNKLTEAQRSYITRNIASILEDYPVISVKSGIGLSLIHIPILGNSNTKTSLDLVIDSRWNCPILLQSKINSSSSSSLEMLTSPKALAFNLSTVLFSQIRGHGREEAIEIIESLRNPISNNTTFTCLTNFDLQKLPEHPARRELLLDELNYRIIVDTTLTQNGHPAPETLKNKLAEALSQLDSQIIRSKVSKILPFEEPEIKTALLETGPSGPREIQFVSGGRNQEVQLRRARWITTFPSLQSVLTDPHLANCVDSGFEFIASLAKKLEIKPAIVKRLRLCSSDTIKKTGIYSIETFARLLNSIDINFIPDLSNPESPKTEALLKCIRQSSKFVQTFTQEPKTQFEIVCRLLKNMSGKWEENSKLLATQKIAECEDFIGTLSCRTLIPFILTEPSRKHNQFGLKKEISHVGTSYFLLRRPDLIRLQKNQIGADEELEKINFLETASLFLIQQLSCYWHTGNFIAASDLWHKSFGQDDTPDNSVKGKLEKRRVVQAWAPIINSVTSPDHFQFVPLTTSSALRAEGQAMKHCVGAADYIYQCMSGSTHIISVRDSSGSRVGTLELAADTDKKTVTSQQFNAHCNNLPSRESRKAVQWLVKAVNCGAIPANWELVVKQREITPHFDHYNNPSFSEILGFDPLEVQSWEESFSEFASLMPAEVRSKDPYTFLHRLFKTRTHSHCSPLHREVYEALYLNTKITA